MLCYNCRSCVIKRLMLNLIWLVKIWSNMLSAPWIKCSIFYRGSIVQWLRSIGQIIWNERRRRSSYWIWSITNKQTGVALLDESYLPFKEVDCPQSRAWSSCERVEYLLFSSIFSCIQWLYVIQWLSLLLRYFVCSISLFCFLTASSAWGAASRACSRVAFDFCLAT